MTRIHSLARWVVTLSITGACLAADEGASSTTQPAALSTAAREALQAKARPLIAKGLKFQAAGQRKDGGWPGPEPESDPAITAIVLQGFIQDPDYGPHHAIVTKGLEFLVKYQQPDGGIYDPRKPYLNYTTSVAVMALAAANLPELQSRMESARKWLKDNQWVEGKCDADGRNITPSHPWYGGAGYGRSKRPDLSNTQMMLQALHESGLPTDDPAYRKALQFVQRCQMLAVTNDQPFAMGATDGGFIYTPANGGHSMAGEENVNGGKQLRSYGSMTYSGFKSMIYANVDRHDPRVKAAWGWIKRNYTLESNPNMPGRQSQEGLYYFYQVFAKTLSAWGEPVVTSPDGKAHDWRNDLIAALKTRQHEDGSWDNPADRWMEGYPHLVTGYCVLALQAATGGR